WTATTPSFSDVLWRSNCATCRGGGNRPVGGPPRERRGHARGRQERRTSCVASAGGGRGRSATHNHCVYRPRRRARRSRRVARHRHVPHVGRDERTKRGVRGGGSRGVISRR